MTHSITVNSDLTVHVVHADGDKEFFLANYDPRDRGPFPNVETATRAAEELCAYPNIWEPFVSTEDRAAKENEGTAAFNRDKRNQLLADSDWTQMNDSPLTDEAKTSWATYRTALRDLTAHTNWPNLEDADWPTEPS